MSINRFTSFSPVRSPPGARRRPSAHNQDYRPTVAGPSSASRNASPASRYNPLAYGMPAGFAAHRRPSASPSPMRGMSIDRGDSEQYNPQQYGPVAGGGGEFVPRQETDDEAPPPPYSPPHRSPLQVTTPPSQHRRQSSWPNQPIPGPISPQPSTATTAQFSPSPYSQASASSTNTTPMSPMGSTDWSAPAQKRRNSPPQAPTMSPQMQNGQFQPPPPPPGPPPRTEQSPGPPSASRSSSIASIARGQIPPPPPGPPPRNNSIPRTPTMLRSVSSATAPDTGSPKHERERRPSFSRIIQEHRESVIPPVPPLPARISRETVKPAQSPPTSPPIPPIPPKRRYESDAGMNYRDGQRRSPKTVEDKPDKGKARDMSVPRENNPWRDAMTEGGQPMTEGGQHSMTEDGDTEMGGQSPLTTPKFFESKPRRKPISPTVITHDLAQMRPQLPTPQTGLSPMSPEMMAFTPLHTENDQPMGSMPAKRQSEDFLASTRKRYEAMLAAEVSASSDEDKVKIFLEFVANEAAVRTAMYKAGKSDTKRLSKLSTMLSTTRSPSQIKPSMIVTPVSPVPDTNGLELDGPTKRETKWWGQDLSAAALEAQALEAKIRDEESSRGRTSSRWWETSCDSSSMVRSDGIAEDDFGRKSMRYSRNTPRQSLKEIAELQNEPTNPRDPASFINSSAYPPDRKMSRSRSRPTRSMSRPRQRRVKTSLDIAPLLTLLPPYPREYPAVNNSHPSLAIFRNLVRTLNQLDALVTLKSRFSETSRIAHEKANLEAMNRRNVQASRISTLYSAGNLEYAQIEAINADFETEEAALKSQALQEDFDRFQKEVVDVAHKDLHERISAASAAYADLAVIISKHEQASEDDDEEKPELLEKLTCLKWIFDVRELLHREVFQLLSERNERYRTLVLSPLLDARDTSRISTAKAFFENDAHGRSIRFGLEQQQRYASFIDTIEREVTAGVEDIRSGYWDVAPTVLECLEKIPRDLRGVVPIVPAEEEVRRREMGLEGEGGMGYLERKMEEAERAMSGFLEGQTELLCLLHGVKSDFERVKGGNGNGKKEVQEEELTRDLKEKVGCIEDEWKNSLGAVFEDLREVVRAAKEAEGIL